MKRILIAGALALATAAPAFAADLPPAAPPPPRAPVAYVPAPVFSWTGFYIGVNTGYAFGQSEWNSPIGTTGNFDVSGPMAGLTLGGNYQIGQFVVGAETDIDWQNVRGSLVGGNCNLGPGAPASCAYANIRASINALPWSGNTELGWTAGAGVEVAMTDNWTAKIEYLFADFQAASCGAANCLAVPTASVNFDESMVRG